MHVVGAAYYHIIVHIFLFLKTTVYNTSILNRLVAVPVQGYAHAHIIKLYHIYIYIYIYM